MELIEYYLNQKQCKVLPSAGIRLPSRLYLHAGRKYHHAGCAGPRADDFSNAPRLHCWQIYFAGDY